MPSTRRRKRQVVPDDSLNPPSAQDISNFNQNLQQEESRLQNIIRNIMNSDYMPSRDQIIQLLTTILTLLLMTVLGPALGSNASMVQSIVRQIVPVLVTAGVHYAADQASGPQKALDAPITDVQLEPVQPSQTSATL